MNARSERGEKTRLEILRRGEQGIDDGARESGIPQYASQEAEAAQRICDALRAAGNSIMIAREGLCIQHTPNRRDKVLGRIAPDALLKFAKKQ